MDIERIRSVILQMKLQEKVALAGGGVTTAAVDRLRVESIALGDELLPYAVTEPTQLALGCTFSPELAAAVSKARSVDSARSHRAFAGTVSCGLILDPMRADACDFFSEDPWLAAELLKSYASAGVIGYVFTDSLGQGRFVNRTVDARALYELYLYPLAKAGSSAAAIMLDGGYLNGSNVAASRSMCDLYTSYIPQDAMVVAPYECNGGAAGVASSIAYRLGMDGAEKKAIMRAVESGEIFENKLNYNIERTLATVVKTHEFYKKPFDRSGGDFPRSKLITDSSVLLKNDGVLPVKVKNITVFGDKDVFSDGAVYSLIPIKDAAKKHGAFNVFLVTGYENDGIDPAELSAVCSTAAVSPTVIVLCGSCATPIPIADSVNAIMFCPCFPTVSAVLAMLTKSAPRGHLPFSWCADREAYPRNNKRYLARGDFRYESVYNGYRLFDNFESNVMFPFGHGLDYTRYEVTKYRVSCDGRKISVDFVIKNVGEYAGTAVCQVYLTLIGGSVYGLSKRLSAFKRVALEKTENSHVVMDIDTNDLSVFDERNNTFVPVGGKYRVDLGLSSTDIRASGTIKIPAGSRVNAGLSESVAPSYYKTDTGFEPTAPEIEKLLKVPFIKKPDEHPELEPPPLAKTKKLVRHAEKTIPKRLLPIVKYKISTTPERYGKES